MFTFTLCLLTLLLALGVFVQHRAFRRRGLASSNFALEAQLDQMIASLDAAERDERREQREFRRLERKSAKLSGEMAPSSHRREKPDQSTTLAEPHPPSSEPALEPAADLPSPESIPALNKPLSARPKGPKKRPDQFQKPTPTATPSTENLPPQAVNPIAHSTGATSHPMESEPIHSPRDVQRPARTTTFWRAIASVTARIVTPILNLPRLFLSLFVKRA